MSTSLAVTATILALGPTALYVLPHLLKVRAKRALRKRCGELRRVVLTYDDGPSAILTPLVLDELARWNAKATFFATGKHAQAHPELIDRIVAEGHELGCHTYHHRHPWIAGPLGARADVDDGYRALEPWIPADGLFRPPHGKIDLLTWLATARRRAPLGWWTLDTGDTWLELPPIHEIVDAVAATDGAVVLMHDTYRGDARCRFVVELTRRLCAHAHAKGLSISPLGALLRAADGAEAA
jgi:peptidoglycan-N-acetylglucosamine deacetylase